MFRYEVWYVQDDRVTFINGKWQGGDSKPAIESFSHCPLVWDALNKRGKEGWRLIATSNLGENHQKSEKLYLEKR